MLQITPTLAIDEQAIQEEFIRASGPGGQHVNKAATAVQLRFDVFHPSLPAEVRERLVHLAGKRISDDGLLIIEARRFRSQERNRQDALERLVALIRQAAKRPKSRKKTRPTRASQQRRLESKRQRAKIKANRRFDPREEE
jgi:ribosome-associated protein